MGDTISLAEILLFNAVPVASSEAYESNWLWLCSMFLKLRLPGLILFIYDSTSTRLRGTGRALVTFESIWGRLLPVIISLFIWLVFLVTLLPFLIYWLVKGFSGPASWTIPWPCIIGILVMSRPIDFALIMFEGDLSLSLMYSGLIWGELTAPSYCAPAVDLFKSFNLPIPKWLIRFVNF